MQRRVSGADRLHIPGGVQRLRPGAAQARRVFVFSDNLSWQSIDGTVVTGLAGTHSGTHTILRRTKPNDVALAQDIVVWQYEATFVLNAVTHDGQQLGAGQVAARGVWYFKEGVGLVDAQGQPVNDRRHAVTGGTGPYSQVRGQGFEPFDGHIKTLEIAL
jgi:hypothetical protein